MKATKPHGVSTSIEVLTPRYFLTRPKGLFAPQGGAFIPFHASGVWFAPHFCPVQRREKIPYSAAPRSRTSETRGPKPKNRMRGNSDIALWALLTLLALGTAGCRHEGLSDADPAASAPTTYARVVATVADGFDDSTTTRAFTGQDTGVDALPVEKKIVGVLFMGQKTGIRSLDQADYKDEDANELQYKSVPFRTSPFTERLTLIINGNNLLSKTNLFDDRRTMSYTQMDELLGSTYINTTEKTTFSIGTNGFIATAALQDAAFEIQPNLSEETVRSGNSITQNVISFPAMERIVAKAQLEQKSTFSDNLFTAKYGAKPVLRSWAVQGSAKTAYLYKNHAGGNHSLQNVGGKNLYDGLESYVHNDANGANMLKMSDVMSKYAFRGRDGETRHDLTSAEANGYFTNPAGRTIPKGVVFNYMPRLFKYSKSVPVLDKTGAELSEDGGQSVSYNSTSDKYTHNYLNNVSEGSSFGKRPDIQNGGIYFLENSHAGDTDGSLGYDRIAHAVIYANADFIDTRAYTGETLSTPTPVTGIPGALLLGDFVTGYAKQEYSAIQDLDLMVGDAAAPTTVYPTYTAPTDDEGRYVPENVYLAALGRLTNEASAASSTDAYFNCLIKGRMYWVEAQEAFVKGLPAGYFTAGRVKKVTRSTAAVADVTALPTGTLTADEQYLFLVIDAEDTFYAGQDGKLYDTLLSARAAGNTESRRYDFGQMVYLHPLNLQGTEGNYYSTDTRRNNIYDLKIAGIEALGYSYNPIDPEDPNAPRPLDNPDEPDPYPVPTVNKTELWIRVQAAVIDWNYQSEDVVIGASTNSIQ